MKIISILLLLVIFSSGRLIAQTITGHVTDTAGRPLSFATIKFGNSKQGVIASLEGKFTINNDIKSIEVSHTGYITQKVEILQGIKELAVILQPSAANLEPIVIVKVSGNKLKRILNTAVANRSLHNPDNYDWYQCNIYYKMVADLFDPAFSKDTATHNDTTQPMPDPHFMLTETYSRRTWQKPANLQEEIIATRMSGFKKPILSGLVTDVLPFHVYNDFINLNGKEFYNPVSKGLFRRFQFKLSDEIIEKTDTIWVIDFTPKIDPAELAGTLYITSDGYAVTHIIAHSIDAASKKDMGIEQQYAKYDGRWLPQQLNYILKWQIGNEDSIIVSIKGTSVIDSVTFKKTNNFKFDKAHTIIILPNAEERRDSILSKLRPIALDEREQQTYQVLDSTYKKVKMEKLVYYGGKILEGKFPAGPFDININRLYSYNAFENNRIGFGMQTNEKISKKISIGGWAGYGTGDKQWKYGAFAEIYADRYKEFIISASYYIDLRDPGRLQIHSDIDNNTLRTFLISRADKVKGWNVSLQRKLGYLTAEITAGSEDVQPQYEYTFKSGNKFYRSFSINEASINLRYAFGETSAPFLGRYYSNETKYPILYGKIVTGKITNADINYTQAIAAISFAKNINRVGKEHFLLSGGITFNNQSLPLSKLFAGNGFLSNSSFFYAFGAMETMLPYQFYSDRFINFYWLHQFNRSLFRAKIITTGLTTAPKPAVAYNVLYGDLSHPADHSNVIFSVPVKRYHEAGLILNSIVRLKIFGLYYAAFNVGYFHNIPNAGHYPNEGRLVYGIGLEL